MVERNYQRGSGIGGRPSRITTTAAYNYNVKQREIVAFAV